MADGGHTCQAQGLVAAAAELERPCAVDPKAFGSSHELRNSGSVSSAGQGFVRETRAREAQAEAEAEVEAYLESVSASSSQGEEAEAVGGGVGVGSALTVVLGSAGHSQRKRARPMCRFALPPVPEARAMGDEEVPLASYRPPRGLLLERSESLRPRELRAMITENLSPADRAEFEHNQAEARASLGRYQAHKEETAKVKRRSVNRRTGGLLDLELASPSPVSPSTVNPSTVGMHVDEEAKVVAAQDDKTPQSGLAPDSREEWSQHQRKVHGIVKSAWRDLSKARLHSAIPFRVSSRRRRRHSGAAASSSSDPSSSSAPSL